MGWGDELMVTGHVRALVAKDPRRVRVVIKPPRFHESWEGNPHIARREEVGDFQEYHARPNGLRPYIAAKGEERWTWQRHEPPAGELYFSAAELEFGARHAGRIIVEPSLKGGASPNKDWGWERWVELARLMRARGLEPTQLGPAATRRLPGATFVETATMRYAAAVMAGARGAVLPEGGLHHVAAAVKTPAVVVIFGGFISPEVTGYAGHTALFDRTAAHPLGCGWRRSCRHCSEAMAKFPPGLVLERLEVSLVQAPRDLAA